MISGCIDAFLVAAVPAVSMPAAAKSSRVRVSPSNPWSMLWFDAVVQTSYPSHLSAGTIAGGAEKTG